MIASSKIQKNSPTTVVGNEYSFKILSTLSKANKISDQMLLQISHGPLWILYGLEGGFGSFQFFVSPYVNTDDSDYYEGTVDDE